MIEGEFLLKVFGFDGDGGKIVREKLTIWLDFLFFLGERSDAGVDFETIFRFKVSLRAEKHSVVCNNNLKAPIMRIMGNT